MYEQPETEITHAENVRSQYYPFGSFHSLSTVTGSVEISIFHKNICVGNRLQRRRRIRSMGDALAELEQILRSSKDKLTQQEEHVLRKCKEKAVRDFMTGALVASGITWTVMPRLGFGNRLNTAGAAAILSGIWGFDKALNSCLDHVLSLEGSRLQRELATILLTKHSHNPWRMQLVNKHFYLEKVYDDSNLEVPLSRWRHRTLSGDAAVIQRTKDTKDGMSRKVHDATRPVVASHHVEEIFADPLDFIVGYPKGDVDANPDPRNFPPRRRSHGHRRADRRHKPTTTTTTTNNKSAGQ